MLMATLVVSYSRDSTVSPSCTHIFTSPQFFLIFHSVTWARRGGVDVLLRAKHTAIVYHSAFLSVKGPTVTVTHCQKKLLWQRRRAFLVHGYKHKCLEVSLIICSFSTMLVVGSLQRPCASTAVGFGPILQCQAWVSSDGPSFKSNQEAVSYPQNTHASTATVIMSCQLVQYDRVRGLHWGVVGDEGSSPSACTTPSGSYEP